MTKLTATNLEADFRFAVNPHKCRLKLNFGVWLTLGLFWVLEQFGRECFSVADPVCFLFLFFFSCSYFPPPHPTPPHPPFSFFNQRWGGGWFNLQTNRSQWEFVDILGTAHFNYSDFLSVLTFCNLLKFAEFVFFFTLISQYVTVW